MTDRSIAESIAAHPSSTGKMPRLVSVSGNVSNIETTLDVTETIVAKKCGGNCNCNC